MAVYVIHFDTKLSHAQHYVGYSSSMTSSGRMMLRRRIANHARNTGARLMAAVNDAGIGWRVVKVYWDGDRALERKIKRSHHRERYCPVCRGERVQLRADYWSHGQNTARNVNRPSQVAEGTAIAVSADP